MNQVVQIPQRPITMVDDVIPILDSARFDHMARVAGVMAKCSYIPASLQDEDFEIARANCFLVVNQATRWQMDPFALAQHAYALHGKIGYEGKVIIAAINSDSRIKGRMRYAFDGDIGTPKRQVTISATFADTGESECLSGTVEEWRTKEKNGAWKQLWCGNADQQLIYRGSREWCRRYMPERLLGVYSDDELHDIANRHQPMRDVTPKVTPSLPDIPDIPDAEPNVEPETAQGPNLLDDQSGFMDMLHSCLSAGEDRSDIREVILSNNELTRRCTPENRKQIATLYREALG